MKRDWDPHTVLIGEREVSLATAPRNQPAPNRRSDVRWLHAIKARLARWAPYSFGENDKPRAELNKPSMLQSMNLHVSDTC